MSIIAHYQQISSNDLESLIKDESLLDNFILVDDSLPWDDTETHLNLDKAWHGIFFILDELNHDAAIAIDGIIPLEGKGLTHVAYVKPDDVKKLSALLTSIGEEDFKQKFNPELLNEKEAYPLSRDWNNNEIDYLLQHFKALKSFYEAAAEKNNGIITYFA